MEKRQFIAAVAAETPHTQKTVEEILDASFDLIETLLCQGQAFAWPGFGALKPKPLKKRMGRNPITGADIIIPASSSVKFSLAAKFKKALNQGK